MITMNVGLRNARLQAIADTIEGPGGSPVMHIYPGEMPSNPGVSAGVTPLVTLPVPLPFALNIENGIMEGSDIPETMATESGTAGWARIEDGDGNGVLDLLVGELDEGGNLTTPVALPSVVIYQGMLIEGVSLIFTEG